MENFIILLFGWILTSSPFIIGGVIFYFVKMNKVKKKIIEFEHYNKDLLSKIKKIEEENNDLRNQLNAKKENVSTTVENKNDTLQNEAKNRILDRFQYKSDKLKDVIKSALFVVENNQCSAFEIQNYLKIGHLRANTIIDVLEEMRVVGKFNGIRPREVFFSDFMNLESHLNTLNIIDDESRETKNVFTSIYTSPTTFNPTTEEINFNDEEFIKIEIEKRLLDLNPKTENFILNDEKLLDDIMHFVIEENSTNRLGGEFNISYNNLQIILRDLEILRLIKENTTAYGYSPTVKTITEYEWFKRDYNSFKENSLSLPHIEKRIIEKVESRLKDIQEQNSRWNELEEERKKEEIRIKLIKQKEQKDLQNKVKEEMVQEGVLPKIHTARRERIPQEVKDAVWNRDSGRCVECGSKEKLEFDHIVPFSKGGSNTIRNLQLLCETCNRQKSNKIG